MNYSIKIIFLFAIFSVLVLQTQAEERLASRFTYFSTDEQCSYKTKTNWNTWLTMLSAAKYNSTKTTGEYAQYAVDLDTVSGVSTLVTLSGNVEIMVYKNTSVALIDNNVQVEVFHNGLTSTFYVDFSTTRDAWYSLGKYYFIGNGLEYVKFKRVTTSSLISTPALPIRFDLYYDTKTRTQNPTEQNQTIATGLSKTGNWRNSLKSGYRLAAIPKESNTLGSGSIWNPGKLDTGKIQLYIYKPNVKANDTIEIFHNTKVDKIYLKNLFYSNLNLYNPVVAQGWYKIGEFDFSGTGNEYVKLTKYSTDTTFVDCLMFESIKFDGTILNRTVVTPTTYINGLYSGTYPATLEQKEKTTTFPIGFSPQGNYDQSSPSQYFGSTIYSRALWLRNTTIPYFWNPCVVEPGNYELLYYAYYPPKNDGVFTIFSNNSNQQVTLSKSNFQQGQFYSVGTFTFAGGTPDEYIQMNGLDRASDILLEKNISGGAILKQVVVTAHPYFKENVYNDTNGITGEHEISFMVNKGFMFPKTTTTFSPTTSMTRAEFIQSVVLMLGLTPNASLPTFSDISTSDWFKGYIGIARQKGLLYGIPDTSRIYPTNYIARDVAAQIMLNAMEYSGRYTNVKNIFKTKPDLILSKYSGGNSVRSFAKEAYARMLETAVIKVMAGSNLFSLQAITRAEAATVLKEFYESILGSGPANHNADWEMTFNDEFDGVNLDYNKWTTDNYVRFKGLSAKWRENCVVEDGVFKGYNYLDNHSVAYSSGNIASTFKQTYGFYEARYKYPDKAYGSHSSFWTGSSGGDFNYNEGTYPNGISNNNYFMKEPERAHNFCIQMNMAHDFHTISGYLNNTDLFYGLDGKISYEVKNYPLFYLDATKTTNVPYGMLMSTVVTYFDGPLDRDRIDGSFMACDWVRVYKEVTWLPQLEIDMCLPMQKSDNQPIDVAPVLKFNKAMDLTSLMPSTIVVSKSGGGNVPTYKIEQMTPLRFRITFNQNLDKSSEYQVKVKSNIKDAMGNTMVKDTIYSFSTVSALALNVTVSSNSPVKMNGIIQLSATVTGGSGVYSSYQWSGPDGFSSTEKNPSIPNATPLKTGTYTIKVIDNNGNYGSGQIEILVDTTTGFISYNLFENVKIIPNPNNGNFSIADSALMSIENVLVSISDLSGKILYQQQRKTLPGRDRFDINVSKFTAGIYMLNLKMNEAQETLKLIII